MEESRNFSQNNFKCEICDKNISTNMNKTQHIRNVHGELKNFTCNVCNKKFGRKNTLTLHLKNNHQEGPGNFKCDSCEKSFRNQAYLKTHKDSSRGTKKSEM